MTTDEVLERLDSEEPEVIREALRAAGAMREQLVPRLLEIVRTHEPVPDDDEARSLPYLAWYLLAQFRETRALEPIIRFYRTYGPDADIDAGDVTVQDLPRILASMWTGDLELIETFVLDESANEWARGAAVQSVVVALFHNLIPYAEAEAWLDELMATRVRRDASVVWDALIQAAIHLGSHRLLERALPLTDLAEMDDYRDEVRQALQRREGLVRDWQTTGRYYQLVDDAVDATSWWSIFYEKGQSRVPDNTPRPPSPFPQNTQLPPLAAPEDLSPIRTGPKIGRNEPCPCGSGRKFKKCCGG